MDKKSLRQKYKTLRKDLTPELIDELSLDITNNLIKLPIWDKQFYHIFLSIENQNEVNTEFLLHVISGKDKHILISKSDFEKVKMKHYLLTDATKITKNQYGIPEPKDGIEIESDKVDVVFIPLLAYDNLGNRVGYGKGFYDKFLSECKSDTIKIGLSFFEPENTIIDSHSGDIKLDFCVIPDKIYQF